MPPISATATAAATRCAEARAAVLAARAERARLTAILYGTGRKAAERSIAAAEATRPEAVGGSAGRAASRTAVRQALATADRAAGAVQAQAVAPGGEAPLGREGKEVDAEHPEGGDEPPEAEAETPAAKGRRIRRTLYARQDRARNVLTRWGTDRRRDWETWKSMALCRRVLRNAAQAEVKQREDGTCSWHGLVRCASPWICAICAALIGARRAAELQAGVTAWTDADKAHSVALITLTARHRMATIDPETGELPAGGLDKKRAAELAERRADTERVSRLLESPTLSKRAEKELRAELRAASKRIAALEAAARIDGLDAWMRAFSAAEQRLRQSRLWRRLVPAWTTDAAGQRHRAKGHGEVIEGTVRALELTYGQSGWHPHVHMLTFGLVPIHELISLRDEIETEWRRCLEIEGLDAANGVAVDIRSGEAAAAYAAKHGQAPAPATRPWGGAQEVALGVYKNGQRGADGARRKTGAGLAPWQLLDLVGATPVEGVTAEQLVQMQAALAFPTREQAATMTKAELVLLGRRRAVLAFREYAAATKGKRQLVWSHGLRATLAALAPEGEAGGVSAEEKTDEAAAAESDEKLLLLLVVQAREWPAVRRAGARAAVLDAAETGGQEAAAAIVAAAVRRYSLPAFRAYTATIAALRQKNRGDAKRAPEPSCRGLGLAPAAARPSGFRAERLAHGEEQPRCPVVGYGARAAPGYAG